MQKSGLPWKANVSYLKLEIRYRKKLVRLKRVTSENKTEQAKGKKYDEKKKQKKHNNYLLCATAPPRPLQDHASPDPLAKEN